MKKSSNVLYAIFLIIFGAFLLVKIVEVINEKEEPNEDNQIVNPGDVVGPGTNNPSVESRIAVPNTGYVNKVYFNTSLSVEETLNIFKLLDYTNDGYMLITNDDLSHALILREVDGNVCITDYEQENYYFIGSLELADSLGLNIGWQVDEFEFYEIAVEEINGVPTGDENEKLIGLFYTYESQLIEQ